MILALVGGALGAHVVIVDGSTELDEARQKKVAWAWDAWPTAGDQPRLVESSTIPGLKPGFHILVFGVFERDAQARAWSSYLNALGRASYVREVELGATDQYLAAETRLTVAFADGERRLPLPAVEARSCQTGVTMVVSPALPDGTVHFAVSDGVDVCLFPKMGAAFVAGHQLTDCTEAGVDIRCASPLPKPADGYRGIALTATPPGPEPGEDWGWFTADITERAQAAGIHVAASELRVVDLEVDGRVVARVPVPASEMLGYWFFRDGHGPEFHVHQQPDEVWAAAATYFGL